jgi:hypothetical protein
MEMLDLLLWAQQQFGGPGGGRPPGFPAGGGGAGAGAAAGIGVGILICYFVFIGLAIAFSIIVYWKIFTKAGEPGWAAIVPVYNCMILSKICGRGEMFGLLLFVPCVNFVVGIMLTFDLAKVFGKDTGFAIGLLLLGIVFLPILAFGSAEYVGPGGDGGGRRRRRREYEEDDDDDDRPRRRRRDEDDRPRGRRDDDDRIRRRDDDDDDDRPRRPRRRDDY